MGLPTETKTYGPFVIEVWPDTGRGNKFRYAVRWSDLMPEVEPGSDYLFGGASGTRSSALIMAENELFAFVNRTIQTLSRTQAELVDNN